MPISHSLECVFVHIPKTAGTSIEQALGLHGDWRVEDRGRLFGRIQSPDLQALGAVSRFLQHLTIAEIATILPPEQLSGYLKFSVVRNPWDRMVSVFCHPDPDMVLAAQDLGVALTGLTFPEFLRRTEGLSHVHLLPQHRFITGDGGRIMVDAVARFESLPSDFGRIAARLGIPPRLPHANVSATRNGSAYRRFYDADTRAVVAERYAGDIELFQYAF